MKSSTVFYAHLKIQFRKKKSETDLACTKQDLVKLTKPAFSEMNVSQLSSTLSTFDMRK